MSIGPSTTISIFDCVSAVTRRLPVLALSLNASTCQDGRRSLSAVEPGQCGGKGLEARRAHRVLAVAGRRNSCPDSLVATSVRPGVPLPLFAVCTTRPLRSLCASVMDIRMRDGLRVLGRGRGSELASRCTDRRVSSQQQRRGGGRGTGQGRALAKCGDGWRGSRFAAAVRCGSPAPEGGCSAVHSIPFRTGVQSRARPTCDCQKLPMSDRAPAAGCAVAVHASLAEPTPICSENSQASGEA